MRIDWRGWNWGVGHALTQRVLWAVAAISLLELSACGTSDRGDRPNSGRVLIVGMDGMDPILVARLTDENKLPNFRRLAEQGGFKTLGTSMPPQSPVAWSNVIAGCDPGVHQIYDFIHRDPSPADPNLAIAPYLSTSSIQTTAEQWKLRVGQWQIPLSYAPTRLRRQGPTFWNHLVEQGVDTAIYRMPANYPVQEVDGHDHFHCLAGMGVPDLLGSYGDFTLFTPTAPLRGRTVSGGKFVYLHVEHHRAEAEIAGPPNFLLQPDDEGQVPSMKVRFEVVRDPERALVKITVGETSRMLKEGEWSDWVPLEFDTGIPGSTTLQILRAPTSVHGMVRFCAKKVHPKLELFVTPVNIDPKIPAMPISVPQRFAADLASVTGRYFTAGIPEHTAEVQQKGLNEDQWLQKVYLILDERIKQYRYALEQFHSGCLFYYFGTPDLVSHIFWRDQDPDHPGRDPAQGDRYAHVIEDVYRKMDTIVGEAMANLGAEDTLIVLSDHGFCSFRRGFNLNTWLLQHGYLALTDPDRQKESKGFRFVDWSRTRAYGLGLNSLYINQQGREKLGIVETGQDKNDLVSEISAKLLRVRDDDGSQVIAHVYRVARLYPLADSDLAPDLFVGYARNYRASWDTVLGGIPEKILEDNLDRWSGDHCIAADQVPGILFSNRKIMVDDPRLTDIAPSILALCGLSLPSEVRALPSRVRGRAILAAP